MRANVYGIYLIIDGDIGKTMDEESKEAFKQADKVKLRISFTKLYWIIMYVLLISILVYAS